MNQYTEPCKCVICDNKCDFYRSLSMGELQSLDDAKTAIFFKKGETILKKGAFSKQIIFLSKGYVKIIMESNFKKSLILEILGKGNFVNSLFLANNDSSPITVVALTDVTVCLTDTDFFMNLLHKNGNFAIDFLSHFNKNGFSRFKKMSSIALKQTRGRLADTLIHLHYTFKDEIVNQILTRKEIAELSNLSTENTIRTLKEFETEKVIRLKGKKIEITDLDLLKKISDIG
ncbi:MAG: Crp/Fnr family transcriptional regulator [Bacteroidetes bacterium]|nr:Crp/Fnr family transcriptional regulator [Bacteroidota bacterium]